MADDETARLLTEIRDLLIAQGTRQQEALAQQSAAVTAYRSMLRRLVPLLLGVVGLIVVLVLYLMWGVWRRMGG